MARELNWGWDCLIFEITKDQFDYLYGHSLGQTKYHCVFPNVNMLQNTGRLSNGKKKIPVVNFAGKTLTMIIHKSPTVRLTLHQHDKQGDYWK